MLFTVTDPDIDTTSPMDARRSGVQVFVDQYNDKFPKFEEDDGYVIVTAAGPQSGNRTNANLPFYPALWATYLHSAAAAPRLDSSGRTIGYVVEIAWHIGDLRCGQQRREPHGSVLHALPYELDRDGNDRGVLLAWG